MATRTLLTFEQFEKYEDDGKKHELIQGEHVVIASGKFANPSFGTTCTTRSGPMYASISLVRLYLSRIQAVGRHLPACPTAALFSNSQIATNRSRRLL